MPLNARHKFHYSARRSNVPCREDSRTLLMVERIEQFGVLLNPSLCVHSVCTNFVSKLQYFLVDAHIPVSLVVIGTVLSALSAVFEEICRSVMESSDFSESKSDVGLEINDTACIFCVAGSDWWANQKLLEDIGLKHEIDETREAE